MRLDTHQHFWRYDPAHHVWMTDAMDVLKRDYLPEELEPLLRASGFDSTIAVQAQQRIEETAWLLELAGRHPFIRGVVGWVDLQSPSVGDTLERFARRPKLVGVRHVVNDEPDDEFMLRPAFRAGIGRLREFGLTYDLLLFPRHLPVAVRLVREFPDQPFVLDHIAKPFIRDGVFSPWREELGELARFPNVFCKLSGMVTEARWHGWDAGQIHRYVDVVVEAFGAGRLMVGSDWPVCTLSADYASTMGVVADYVRRLTAPVRDGILGDNGARFYGLDPEPVTTRPAPAST
jgi:L-fucono-1,5-lactonase